VKKNSFKQGYRESPMQTTLLGEVAPSTTAKEQRCARCTRILNAVETTYNLTLKGKTDLYCQPCAKIILKPLEQAAEI
jgi:hypothetical protein